MTGTTAVEGLPYPLEADFADVQDAFRLATAVDADIRADQTPFRNFMARPSFIGRSTSNSATASVGTMAFTVGAVEWDNTGGLAVGGVWTQPAAQQPSWWLFGCTILVAQISGTPTVGDLVLGNIQTQTTDQVTTVVSLANAWQRNDESNTAGEWINMFAMAPIYQGAAGLTLTVNGASVKAIGTGSRFWGMYLGPVT
jgi:hypothetical protein